MQLLQRRSTIIFQWRAKELLILYEQKTIFLTFFFPLSLRHLFAVISHPAPSQRVLLKGSRKMLLGMLCNWLTGWCALSGALAHSRFLQSLSWKKWSLPDWDKGDRPLQKQFIMSLHQIYHRLQKEKGKAGVQTCLNRFSWFNSWVGVNTPHWVLKTIEAAAPSSLPPYRHFV